MLNSMPYIFLENTYEILPRGRDLAVDKLPCPGFPTLTNRHPGTRVPGVQMLGGYEVLLVSVTGISKPGSTRKYPCNW